LFSRLRNSKTVRRSLLVAGALGASVALTATMAAGTAAAKAPALPKGSTIPLGDGYMGVGYVHDSKAFKPDTRGLDLNKAEILSPDFAASPPPGIDVSHYQGTINWTSVKAAGIQWAYIKATEGTTYTDPTFSANYTNAYYAGVIRGAYHFAQPGSSSGAAQANYFASHGGAWSADNLTLPGMLDLEGGCYGLSAASMQSWILDFYNTYKADTGRDVVIYTSPSWWSSCTGNWTGMSTRSPLDEADWTTASNPVAITGFPYATMWQYTDAGSVSGISGAVDRDRFNGDHSRLLALANNTP
jgi:GH25 family lysozyme M1 (1,4-beta-N-acetylmuramidase)